MTKPYPEDFCTRGVAAAGAGGSCREAPQQFGIGASSVARGHSAPGGRAALRPSRRAGSAIRVSRTSAARPRRRGARLPLHGIRRALLPRAMSTPAMARLGASSPRRKSPFKKTVSAAGPDRPDIAALRMRWQQGQSSAISERLEARDAALEPLAARLVAKDSPRGRTAMSSLPFETSIPTTMASLFPLPCATGLAKCRFRRAQATFRVRWPFANSPRIKGI